MPNFENLRKQAKLYLRWHRDGYHPVAAAIRAALPSYRQLTDRQILAASFKLGDAQELVARQSGFESWQALKTGMQAMPKPADPVPSMPVLSRIEAQLYVSNIKSSCEYYAKLGFVVAFTYGEPPFYGQVTRDDIRLNLRLVCESVFAGDIREREILLSASITVDSPEAVRQLFDQYKSAGIDFKQPLKKEPWGARTFIVRDPDGNLVLFAGPAA